MNKFKTDYISAIEAHGLAFDAIEGEGTDQQWDTFMDAQTAKRNAEDALLNWSKEVALEIASPEQAEKIISLFSFTTIGAIEIKQTLIERALLLEE